MPHRTPTDVEGVPRRVEEERARLRGVRIANLAHGLKAPITLALDAADHSDDPLTARLVREQALRMLEVVHAMIDLMRDDAGPVIVAPVDTDAALLVRGVVEEFRPLLTARRGRLRLEAPSALPARLDPEQFRTAVTNLVVNAVRWAGNPGAVRCEVALHRGQIRVRVDDDGPGIPTEQREDVFGRYRQLDAEGAGTKSGTGSGIGLPIVRKIS